MGRLTRRMVTAEARPNIWRESSGETVMPEIWWEPNEESSLPNIWRECGEELVMPKILCESRVVAMPRPEGYWSHGAWLT